MAWSSGSGSLVSLPSQFSKLLNGLPSWPLFLILLIVSLLLIFYGRKIVKVLAFLIVGLIGASIGGMLGAQYLTSIGVLGRFLGILIGFVAGGLIGLLLVSVGIGLIVGYAAYLLTIDLVSNSTAAFVVGFVFFIIGVVVYNKILTVVTAVAGGFLLYDALAFYINPTIAALLAIIVTLVGVWHGLRSERRKSNPFASNP